MKSIDIMKRYCFRLNQNNKKKNQNFFSQFFLVSSLITAGKKSSVLDSFEKADFILFPVFYVEPTSVEITCETNVVCRSWHHQHRHVPLTVTAAANVVTSNNVGLSAHTCAAMPPCVALDVPPILISLYVSENVIPSQSWQTFHCFWNYLKRQQTYTWWWCLNVNAHFYRPTVALSWRNYTTFLKKLTFFCY